MKKKTSLLFQLRIKPWFFGCAVHSPCTITTELSGPLSQNLHNCSVHCRYNDSTQHHNPSRVLVQICVHSVQQESSGLIFRTFCSGSDVRYTCHHNSSLLFFPYLCICGISLSSIYYNQSCCVYINQRHKYICLI